MSRIVGICAAATLFLATSAAQAQLLFEPTDDMVREVAQATRANIALGRYADGSSVAPETDAELAVPIATFELEQQTVRRGVLTGEMQACGMDWAAISFAPYMKRVRAGNVLSQKQIVYVGMLHGFAQGQVAGALANAGLACSRDRMKQLTSLASEPIPLP